LFLVTSGNTKGKRQNPHPVAAFLRKSRDKGGATAEKVDSEEVMDELKIDFDKMQGLAPAIVQDAANGDLLMVGFMNREALEVTLATGFVTFYSRTRRKLWTKGETSGNRLQVVEAFTDCDRDTVLFRVNVLGDGVVCHTGTRSCFTERLVVGTSEEQVPHPRFARVRNDKTSANPSIPNNNEAAESRR
jgi:phosphoribosyl-AMP cyclohydrolase